MIYLGPFLLPSKTTGKAMCFFRLIENYTFFKVSLFFKQALQSWLQFQFHPPEKIEQILWLNSNVLVDKIPVFMGKMFEKGILFLNDIVNWHGRVSYVLHGVIRIVQEGLLNPRVQPIDDSIKIKTLLHIRHQCKIRFLDINMHFIEQNIHVLCNMKSYECHLMKIIKG